MKKFSFKDVPAGYKLCFNDQCPKRDDCIRYLAGQHLPEDSDSGAAVYPNALRDGVCSYFKQTRVIHGAWGFRNLYKGVHPKDLPVLRAQVTNYLGGPVATNGFMHGNSLLTPEQQDQIHEFFKAMGYTKNPVFEGYSLIYDFTA